MAGRTLSTLTYLKPPTPCFALPAGYLKPKQ